jgi:hypothetical protein
MNIALSSLVVLLLILPGVLLSYAYRRGSFKRAPVSLGPLRDEISLGIVWAVVIHTIALPSTTAFYSEQVVEVLQFLLGVPSSQETIDPDSLQVAGLYLLITNGGAFLIGYGLHGLVRWFHLDLILNFLRFNNDWFYIFSGEVQVLEAPQKERTFSDVSFYIENELPDATYASALVDQAEGSIIYWGILEDYTFDRSGQLSSILLSHAQRRPLHNDRSPDEEAQDLPTEDDRFYAIRGSYFLIKYEHIKTLNIEYVVIEPANDADGEEESGKVESLGK